MDVPRAGPRAAFPGGTSADGPVFRGDGLPPRMRAQRLPPARLGMRWRSMGNQWNSDDRAFAQIAATAGFFSLRSADIA